MIIMIKTQECTQTTSQQVRTKLNRRLVSAEAYGIPQNNKVSKVYNDLNEKNKKNEIQHFSVIIENLIVAKKLEPPPNDKREYGFVH